MNYEILTTENFDKKAKSLAKKYHSLPGDLEKLKKELLENPETGDDLGNNLRKVRMAIASKNKGKSGGARVITCNILIDFASTKIYLLTIYGKGEQESISKQEIEYLQQINGLI